MSNPSPSFGERETALADYVGRRVSGLQKQYCDGSADARAAMAELRRGVGSTPGLAPALWTLTVADFPTALTAPEVLSREERDGAATVWERAAYDAITLHALHQQSRPTGMHRPGTGLGTAVQLLSSRAGSEDAVRTRFHALGTAVDHHARLIHLRGLITQFRGFDIGLDYARLAVDLQRLDRGTHADRVLLAWARSYHRKPATAAAAATDPTGDQQ